MGRGESVYLSRFPDQTHMFPSDVSCSQITIVLFFCFLRTSISVFSNSCPFLFSLPAVDLNLGCPLREAKEERFGSYLLDKHEHELVFSMVRLAAANLKIPVTCKIRYGFEEN